ncbi:hypothetical protein B0T22DRAFT_509768 [Podospora appendiculata]|uniref:Uncharacterized protein n=1 Tax=Podospora appendiculata TaxID=314037 RepID=A0AAE0X7I5_9PEZI|nr:hypothetical protein B0T22DRAFT_509768 [Podospora appendiculata]
MSTSTLPVDSINSAANTKVTSIDISIASAPCDIDNVLLDKARALVQALETPKETMLRQCGADSASFYTIALGVDVGLFDELAKDAGSPKTTPELAAALEFGADLLTMGHIIQTGADESTNNYQTPTSVIDNPFTFSHQTSLNAFEHMLSTPPFLKQFSSHMGGYRLSRPSWTDTAITCTAIVENVKMAMNARVYSAARTIINEHVMSAR